VELLRPVLGPQADTSDNSRSRHVARARSSNLGRRSLEAKKPAPACARTPLSLDGFAPGIDRELVAPASASPLRARCNFVG
jgi:hypothetical protein